MSTTTHTHVQCYNVYMVLTYMYVPTTTGKLQASSVVVSTPLPDTKPPPPTAASTEQPTERELGRDIVVYVVPSL